MANGNSGTAIATTRVLELKKLLNGPSVTAALREVLPKILTPERIVRLAILAVNRTPLLLECDPHSLVQALMDAGRTGLEPDGEHAALVPYDGRVQLQPMVRGLIRLALRSPKVSAIEVACVYAKDEFEYSRGLTVTLYHVPAIDLEHRGPLRCVYAVAQMRDGAKTFVLLTRADVMKAKACSKSAGKPGSPWNRFEAAMWEKTAVKKLCKMLPTGARLEEALAVDARDFDERDVIDAPPVEAPARAPRSRNATKTPRPKVEDEPEPEPDGDYLSGDIPEGPPASEAKTAGARTPPVEGAPAAVPAPPASASPAPPGDEDRKRAIARGKMIDLGGDAMGPLERLPVGDALPMRGKLAIDLALARHFKLGVQDSRAPIVNAWKAVGISDPKNDRILVADAIVLLVHLDELGKDDSKLEGAFSALGEQAKGF